MIKLIVFTLLALVPGCTSSAFTLSSINKDDKVRFELPVAVQWKKDPVIQVCDTAPVTKDEVEMLLTEWEKRGAPKLKVVNSKCEGDPLPGYIHLDQWRDEWRGEIEGAYAVTAVWPKVPEAGIIMVPDGDMGVLRHELGHIWIQGHAPLAGHVICPFVGCTGDIWEGVRKSFKRGGY